MIRSKPLLELDSALSLAENSAEKCRHMAMEAVRKICDEILKTRGEEQVTARA